MILPKHSFPDLRLSQVQVSNGRSLPRWETHGAIYHVAFHLADSVPQTQLAQWREFKESIVRVSALERRGLSDDEQERLRAFHEKNIERYLSAGHGACLLRHPDVARSVAMAVFHDNGSLYAIHEYCVMPNHMHVIMGNIADGCDMSSIVSTWKRVAAHTVNRLTSRTGPVWMRDAYTRIIRNENEYRNQMLYVWNNPEAAGLETGFLRERFVEW